MERIGWLTRGLVQPLRRKGSNARELCGLDGTRVDGARNIYPIRLTYAKTLARDLTPVDGCDMKLRRLKQY